jgi:hypothetical protein
VRGFISAVPVKAFDEIEAVVNGGERLRGGGVMVGSTHVSGETPELRVLATLSAKSGDLVDKAGIVTHHLPAVPPAQWVFELRLVDGRWVLTYAGRLPG